MQTLNKNLLEDRYTKTTHLTEAATDVVNYFYQQSQQGKFTEKEAQTYALASLSAMHYGNRANGSKTNRIDSNIVLASFFLNYFDDH